MTAIAIELETSNYWDLIKNASTEIKLALTARLSNALVAETWLQKNSLVANFGSGEDSTFSLHRLNHGLDKLDFFVRQTVLCIEVGIRPRAGEVLKGDEFKHRT